MADSDLSVPDPMADAGPAARSDPLADLTTGAPDAAAAVPRRRKRWGLSAIAAAGVLAGLIAGLLVWAPWIPPPVLRPTGLAAGPATANSISFRWSRPPAGPLPDKYLILHAGTVAASVAGTASTYLRVGLTPASSYRFRVVAVRDGKRSPRSAVLLVRTVTPPIARARLQGSWTITLKYRHRLFDERTDTLFWQAIPACATGACDVTISGNAHPKSFSGELTRAGAVYHGRVVVDFIRCGSAASSFPDPTTLTFRIRVTAATGKHQVWAATALVGTMTGTSEYVSSGIYYCPAHTFKATLSGTTS